MQDFYEPKVGDVAPDFRLPSTRGKEVSLRELKGKDEVLIAEVRPDPTIRGGFWVWAVCDNLRRSSALNAILLAEKVMFGGAAN